jgi:hypothetical protein
MATEPRASLLSRLGWFLVLYAAGATVTAGAAYLLRALLFA